MSISMDELIKEWAARKLYYDVSNGNDITDAVTIYCDGSDVQANCEFDTTYNYYPECIMSELERVQPMPSDIFQWNVINKKIYKKKLDLRLPNELFEL